MADSCKTLQLSLCLLLYGPVLVKMCEYYDTTDFDSLIDDLSSDSLTVTTEEESVSESDHSSTTISVSRNKDSKSNVTRKPRKNRYNPEPVPECQVVLKPRILKTDIRRSYASMIANVINSGDFPLMYGLLETFFTPNFEHRVVKHKPEDDTITAFVRQGIADVATSFYAIMHMDPDPLVTIKDTKIHLISNTTASKIVTEWSYSATSIYQRGDDPAEEECPKQREHELIEEAQQSMVFPNSSSSSSSGNKRKEAGSDPEAELRANTIHSISSSIEAVKKTLPLREKPLPFSFGGMLTLYTDENKVITKMEMEMLQPAQSVGIPIKMMDRGAVKVQY